MTIQTLLALTVCQLRLAAAAAFSAEATRVVVPWAKVGTAKVGTAVLSDLKASFTARDFQFRSARNRRKLTRHGSMLLPALPSLAPDPSYSVPVRSFRVLPEQLVESTVAAKSPPAVAQGSFWTLRGHCGPVILVTLCVLSFALSNCLQSNFVCRL